MLDYSSRDVGNIRALTCQFYINSSTLPISRILLLSVNSLVVFVCASYFKLKFRNELVYLRSSLFNFFFFFKFGFLLLPNVFLKIRERPVQTSSELLIVFTFMLLMLCCMI